MTKSVRLLMMLIISPGFSIASSAQENRIVAQLSGQRLVRIEENVPKNLGKYDQGPVNPDLRMAYVTLMLKPTDEQRKALQQLLFQLQDKSSPNYHKWLTPEEYADRFGLSTTDIAAIVDWLKAGGFKIVSVANGRDFVVLSGTAQQIATVFHTEIHRYKINTEEHIANTVGPAIPEALGGVISGIYGLNDFRPKPAYTDAAGNHFLGPNDISVIYAIISLYSANYSGQGQNVVIAGASDINFSDYNDFSSLFNIQRPALTVYGAGLAGHNVYETEADLDIEWAGAIARSSTIIYVETANQNAFDSAVSAIDNNYGQVLSISFSTCEPDEKNQSPTFPSFFQMEVQKANSQGMTVIASSGDTGPAACDVSPTLGTPNPSIATRGLAVSFPASVPEVTAVGGTEFDESMSSPNSVLWGPFTGAPYFPASALNYIPEIVWNDSPAGSGLSLGASGGGASVLFPKPYWQTGTGVPNDGARDVPDISLNASNNHDDYLFCAVGGCQGGVPSPIGGTSVAAPIFAGMLAITNQLSVLAGNGTGFGNINVALYAAATELPSGPPIGPLSPFNDITVGNNIVDCSSTPDCPNGSFGFTATPGYDQVTGLGSINLQSFTSVFAAPNAAHPNFTLTSSANSLTLKSGASGQLTVTVTPTGLFNQVVSFSCSSNLPSGVSCTFSPSSVNPGQAGDTAVTSNLTIQTTAASAQLSPANDGLNSGPICATLLPGLVLVLSRFRRRKPARNLRVLAFVGLMMCCAFCTGCGGGSAGNGGSTGSGGTPLGTSGIVVTAMTGGSSPISQQLTVTLTVQ